MGRNYVGIVLSDNNFKLQNYYSVINEHFLVCIIDKEGYISYVNALFCELSGYTQQELIGEDYKIINSEINLNSLIDKPWHGKVANKNKSGELYWLDLTIVANYDNDKNLEGYTAIATNISELKKLEAELINSNSRFKGLFENSPDPCWIIDENNLFILCNNAAAE